MATLDAQLGPLWRVGTDLRSGTLQRQALAATAQATKVEALAQMAQVVGADMIMRNYPRGGRAKPRKAGFGYELHGDTKATLNFRPGGFWRIVEDGTKAHTIGAGRGRVTNRGKRIGTRNESIVFKIGGEYRSGPRKIPAQPPHGSPGKKTIKTIPDKWDEAFKVQFEKRLR